MKKSKNNKKKNGMWQMTGHMSLVTCDMWQVTHDMWHMTHGFWWIFSEKLKHLSSNGFGFMILWIDEGKRIDRCSKESKYKRDGLEWVS